MKTIVNSLAVGVLALIVLRSVGKTITPGPNRGGEIMTTDAGDVTRKKFLAIYDTNLKAGAKAFVPRLKDNEFKDSLSAVKAWADMTKDAREKASVGVDKRIKALAETPDQAAQWAEEFSR